MIYIIFTITAITNIFNIILISNNNLEQTRKEKILLFTYSLAELIFILTIFNFIEFTSTSLILALSFIIIWLLSKSYLCIINMNFEIIEDERNVNMQETDNLEETFTQNNCEISENINDELVSSEEIEIVNFVEPEKIEENTEIIKDEKVLNTTEVIDNEEEISTFEETDNEEKISIAEVLDNKGIIDNPIEEIVQKTELADLVESKMQNEVITPNLFYTLSDIVTTAEINKEEEKKEKRRSLALRVIKINGENH